MGNVPAKTRRDARGLGAERLPTTWLSLGFGPYFLPPEARSHGFVKRPHKRYSSRPTPGQ